MIYVSGPGDGERSREEAGMCTRRSRRALWRSQSGLLPLLASSSPRPSVRPPARSLVRPSDRRDALLERGEGGGKIRMDARESVDYFIGGEGGVEFFLL